MFFRDRNQAAELLSAKLTKYEHECPLVLGIPRGAVPMADIIARNLHGSLDVVLVHKIGAPDNPEFAIGSVSEFGTVFRSHGMDYYKLSNQDLKKLANDEILRLKRRRELYSPIRHPVNPTDRVVIIVDDGLATGSTMVAAVRAIRSQMPRKVIAAAPVASASAVDLLHGEADEVAVLDVPEEFFSISQFYESFSQITDEEVYQVLQEAARREAKPNRRAA